MDDADRLFAEGLAGAWTGPADDPARPAGNAVSGVPDDERLRDAVRSALNGFLVAGAAPAPVVRRDGGAVAARLRTDRGELVCRIAGSDTGGHRVTVHGRYAGRRLDAVVADGVAAQVAAVLDGRPVAAPAGGRIEGGPVKAVDVVDRVLDVARLDPDRVAVRAGAAELRYGDLAERAGRYAAQLDAAGIGDVVVVPYRRRIDTVVVLLGVLAAGRAFLLRADDGRDEFGAEAASWAGATDTAPEPSAAEPTEQPALRPVPGTAAAYVIFTSGTTGRPKAVVVERDQLAGYCGFLVAEGICGPEVTMPAISAPEFDAIVKQLFGQLAAGGAVTLTATGDVLAEIEAALADATANPTVNTVPTVWAQYLDLHDADLHDGPLRTGGGTLLLGGEALDPALVERTRAAWPGVRIVNLYGPSECTSNATWMPDVAADGDRVPIGTPIQGTDVHVLDERLEPVCPGGVGRLYVAGSGVSRGYGADPRRTAAAFLPEPGSASPGSRMYATGDRVRVTSAGLVYLGRDDAQVKVNGVRVDLETLRVDLSALPGVRAAAVGMVDGALRVFVDIGSDTAAAAVDAHIRRSWRRELHGVRAERATPIPTTSTGKADFRALCAQSARPAPGGPCTAEAPHRVLQIIWSSVFDAQRLDSTTTVSDLGGDSLKRLKLVALYRRILRADVSFDDFAHRELLAEHQELLEARVGRERLDEVADKLGEPAR